ncbi:hypothetical protein WME89_38860 [Sorangium sp. So ce321]|uniref:hypothetical protein n=1 Tax=Sorangium sp. So ce321 TaxID=3133300 RepID=UPI003F5F965C
MLYGNASCSVMGWLLLVRFTVIAAGPEALGAARFMRSQGRRRTVERAARDPDPSKGSAEQ